VHAVTDPHLVATPDHPDRRLGFRGSFNFRDLGGYPAADGRLVRWRTLYRADGIHRMPDDELDELGVMGVRTVLDLRTASELEHGRVEGDRLGITHLHLPVLGETWKPAELDPDAEAAVVLGSLYVQMLDVGAPALAESVRVLAEPARVPAVFHCAAGKDRTGTVVGIALAVAGVPQEEIVADYVLSGERIQRIMDRLIDRDPYRESLQDKPIAEQVPVASAMEALLGLLTDDFGGAAGWLRAQGWSAEQVATLRAKLRD